MTNSDDGFKRLHAWPRRYYKASRAGLDSKKTYILSQSRMRFEKRDDAFTGEREILEQLMTHGIGFFEDVRYIKHEVKG